MSRPVMADAAWYVAEAEAGRDPLYALAQIAETRDVATCGPIRAVVGHRLRDGRVWERFVRAWEVMVDVPSDRLRWDQTFVLTRQMAALGSMIPLEKAHVAACALSIDAVVLTPDAQMAMIPGLVATDRLY